MLGSCMVLPNSMIVQRPPICDTLEKSCQLLNIVCCFNIINCKNSRLCIVSVYRSPSTDAHAGLAELQHIVTELSLYSHHIIIAGDLNIDILSSSTIATAYSEFLSDNRLTQHITEPSRVTATTADHIITTSDVMVSFVHQLVGLSDHLVQFLHADLSDPQALMAFPHVFFEKLQARLPSH